MEKAWYASKTIWGFGLLTLGILGHKLGVLPQSTLTTIIEAVLALLGIYGLRSAID